MISWMRCGGSRNQTQVTWLRENHASHHINICGNGNNGNDNELDSNNNGYDDNSSSNVNNDKNGKDAIIFLLTHLLLMYLAFHYLSVFLSAVYWCFFRKLKSNFAQLPSGVTSDHFSSNPFTNADFLAKIMIKILVILHIFLSAIDINALFRYSGVLSTCLEGVLTSNHLVWRKANGRNALVHKWTEWKLKVKNNKLCQLLAK